MKIIYSVNEMQLLADKLRQGGTTIGFVPTMGYLHEGHLSLIRLAKDKADKTVVSIFVNPTQFSPNEDLDAYPRDFDRDVKMAEAAGADIIFYPETVEMYPPDHMTFVSVIEITELLCGESRPEHFKGVTTICTKLFNAVKPHIAIFGQKDFQQSVVIRKMVRDLNLDLEIITAPIVREEDGLAMSTRNKYLSSSERKEAAVLHGSLLKAVELIKNGEKECSVIRKEIESMISPYTHCRVEYIEILDPVTLRKPEIIEADVLIALAVQVGSARLIDNVVIPL